MIFSERIKEWIEFGKKHFFIICIVCICLILICIYMLDMYKKKLTPHCKPKIVVWDLDETFGNFVELGIFKDVLNRILGRKITDNEFFQLCDLYPEFFRPQIIEILNYLKQKKKNNLCQKVMIYTNNQGPKSWTKSIKDYFEYKLDYPLFDQIIAAYMVNGRHVEPGRTSHMKNVADLTRCTNISADTEICFLDDQYHEGMKHNNVYYINLKPYIYNLSYEDMMNRYLNSSMGRGIENPDRFINLMMRELKRYNFEIETKSEIENEVDHVISKKIMQHLEEFFNKSLRNNSLKKYRGQKRKTLKRR